MLLPSDGATSDSFGGSVAIDGDTIVIGAQGDSDNGANTGSAYVFFTSCQADLTGDGMLNFFDISAFLAAFTAQDPIADFDGNGLFNFFDVSAFLGAFAAGCP
jgi:hypothetical protein